MTIKNKEKLRISIYRTNKALSAQVIDDKKGTTILSGSTASIKEKGTPKELAFKLGEALAKSIKEKKLDNLYYDRRDYRYHGRVKSLAEGLRSGGLTI